LTRRIEFFVLTTKAPQRQIEDVANVALRKKDARHTGVRAGVSDKSDWLAAPSP